jgi:hypothetical protein
MLRIPTLQTTRLILAISAAAAVSACAGGSQQQVTPTSTSVLAPTSTSVLAPASTSARAPQTATRGTSLSSSERSPLEGRSAEGGDDGNGTVVYSSIPKPLHAVASIGFEAYQGLELGDGVNLTRPGKLQRVRYVLTSWGCQNGAWFSGNCVTHGSPTFAVPFTVNVYAIDATMPSRVGSLLTTQTQTFDIPYRPSSDHVRCPDGQTFYSKVDAACVHGLANVIVFDFKAPRVSLPAQIIVSLVYNTTHYGPYPIGESAPCYTSSGGCGYDSLNISTDGNGGPIGSPYDPNGIFDSFTNIGEYCGGVGPLGFRLDTPCWTGYHPQFEVRAVSGSDGNGDGGGHGDGHGD